MTQYSRRHSREHLIYEAEQMKELMRTDLIEVGYMYEGRWKHIGQTYAQQNMLPNDYKLNGFLYEPSKAKFAYYLKDSIVIVAIFTVLISSLLSVFWYFNRQLRKKAKWLNTVLNHAPSALIILDNNGKVLRKELGKIIFSNEEEKKKLLKDDNTVHLAPAIIAKIKNVNAIGLVKNINQLPSNITKDCLRVPSTNSPKINPIITGTTEKPYLLINVS